MTRSGFHAPPLPRTGWGGPARRPDGQQYRPELQPAPAAPYVARRETETLIERGQTRQASADVVRDARLSMDAPRIPWDVFVRDVLDYRDDEHFALIGPTGQGKTTMLRSLLPLHYYVTVFATKPVDDTMDALIRTGYTRLDRWRSIPADEYPKRVLWPNIARLKGKEARLERQRAVFDEAFDAIFMERGWTVAIDELWYFSNRLKMDGWIEEYLSQARALHISLIIATQRPAYIPTLVYDQSTHLMFWRDNDETNLKRISGISYRSADLIRGIVSNLERFQVLYINTRTGQMCRTRCPDIR